MRRIVTCAAVALSVACPATASADWILPAVAARDHNHFDSSFGVHCGAGMFGVYRIVGGIITAKGVQSSWTARLDITQDGALHRVTNLSFPRYMHSQRGVEAQVRSIYRQTRYRYLNQNGVSYIQGLWHGGQVQDLQAFNPFQGTIPANMC